MGVPAVSPPAVVMADFENQPFRASANAVFGDLEKETVVSHPDEFGERNQVVLTTLNIVFPYCCCDVCIIQYR